MKFKLFKSEKPKENLLFKFNDYAIVEIRNEKIDDTREIVTETSIPADIIIEGNDVSRSPEEPIANQNVQKLIQMNKSQDINRRSTLCDIMHENLMESRFRKQSTVEEVPSTASVVYLAFVEESKQVNKKRNGSNCLQFGLQKKKMKFRYKLILKRIFGISNQGNTLRNQSIGNDINTLEFID